ncbi:hypothetical protein NPIL_379521 [Nephila pilipes]|uniref:Uncharacterized protein n=1 Tax=Nephila pilipes TaxID=299642 RepID=A0A8X6J026_NEPPI|nr:hypothetical protein NPIL_379521 [Nephila pilipes]
MSSPGHIKDLSCGIMRATAFEIQIILKLLQWHLAKRRFMAYGREPERNEIAGSGIVHNMTDRKHVMSKTREKSGVINRRK